MTLLFAFVAGFAYAAITSTLVVLYLKSIGVHLTYITDEEKERLHHG